MDPFVALMRTYCIDYTNSHDLSVCDSIMEPDYVVHIAACARARRGLQAAGRAGVRAASRRSAWSCTSW